MQNIRHNPKTRALSLLLAALTVLLGLPMLGISARAAATPTSLGLAMQGVTAHRDHWIYVAGGKGGKVNGVRATDCAGLLYSYYSDCGVSGCAGGATSQVRMNTIFSGSLLQGLPRIHGLALTNSEPGGYSHIGIYIGNNESCDNSMEGVNMVRASVYSRHWDGWHLFDLGTKYPDNGWYEFDGRMVHYTSYEYDVDTEVGGYHIGSDGFAYLEDGKIAPVDRSILSGSWATARQVADYLSSKGWSGSDDPDDIPFDHNAVVSASDVNLRSQPNTSSRVVATLARNTKLLAGTAVNGQSITVDGKTYSKWYPVSTASGKSGYILEAYVKLNLKLPAPSISFNGEAVAMQAGDFSDDIYYTTDCSDPGLDNGSPALNTVPYVSPVYQTGCTYKAAVIKNGVMGPVTTATVMSNGAVFRDFLYQGWFAPHVDQAVTLGLFSGNGDGTFNPTGPITRIQFVVVLANLSGEDLSGYTLSEDIFPDVSTSAYYSKALAWAIDKGIVSLGSKFYPNWVIPREQMCTMLDRYLVNVQGVTEVDTSGSEDFADDGDISEFARDAVYRMQALGIVNGVGGNRFNPQGTSMRCEACAVAVRFHNLFESEF